MSVTRNQMTEQFKQDMYGYLWDSYPVEPPKYEELFDIVDSNAAYESFTTAIGLGELLEKPENEDIQADSPMEGYTVVCKNRSFARKVRFSYESVADAQKTSNLLSTVVGSWGRSLPITKEKFYAKFFNYGAYTAGHDVFDNSITDVVSDPTGKLIYDNKPFFSTAHPDKVGNTYANYVASAALTYDNLKSAYNVYTTTNNRDERGEVIELRPDVLLIPPALKFTAQEILNSVTVPLATANTSMVNVLASIVDAMDWSYLTDTDGWFLGKRKAGLMATDREDVSLDFYKDEENLSFVARIFCRFGGVITNWRFWLARNIASS